MKPTTLIAILTLAAAPMIQARPLSILQIRDSLHTDPSICLPESFETDVHEMQKNWYLQTYADIDADADSRSSVIPSDEEITARLAAMHTVIEMPFNEVVKSHILAYVDRRKQLVENMLGMSLYYMPIFEAALDRNGLPLELKYLPIIESALNPEAVSRVGATGLWQFMLSTATGEGLEVTSLVDQRRDPYTSSEAAAKYLKKLYGIFNDWSLAIAAYNCGPGNVTKALKRAGDGKKDFWDIYPYLPSETRGYFPAFIAANYAMTYYSKHNISPALARKPIVTDTVHVTRRVHFQQISDVLDIPMAELRTLNPQYRTDVIPGDLRPYALVLPTLQAFAFVANEDSIVAHDSDKYSRRYVVQPAAAGSGRDSKGEYVDEAVVQTHVVKKGETLAAIAKRYGVTQASIRKANKIGKHVTRGQKLKITTYRRRYLTPEPAPVETVVSADTMAVMTADSVSAGVPVTLPDSIPVPDGDEAVQQAPAATTKSAESAKVVQSFNASQSKAATQPAKSQRQKQEQPATQTTHTIKKGENLSKIATRYGITVDALKRANNLKNDNIRAGQKLKIPAKAKSSSKRRR